MMKKQAQQQNTASSSPVLDLLDVARQKTIYEVLSLLALVDDVIGLMNDYAKERKIMFLAGSTRWSDPKEDFYAEYGYHGFKTIWIFEPDLLTWKTFQLNDVIHSQKRVHTFLHQNELNVISYEIDTFCYRGLDNMKLNLFTGDVTKEEMKFDDICTEEVNFGNMFNKLAAFTGPSFKEMIHSCKSNGDGKLLTCSYNYLQRKFFRVEALQSLDNYHDDQSRLIYKPSHHRLFVRGERREFYEIISSTKEKQVRQTAPFKWNNLGCYSMTHDHIYICTLDGYPIGLNVYSYNMITDHWTLIPRPPYLELAHKVCSCVLDNTLLVCFLKAWNEGDKNHIYSYNLGPLKDDDDQWKDLGQLPPLKGRDAQYTTMFPISM